LGAVRVVDLVPFCSSVTARVHYAGMTAALRIIPRFSHLPADVLKLLLASGNIRRLDKGSVLFWEGDEGHDIFFVLDGTVKITKHLNNGREVLLDILGPGETADEWAVLSSVPHFTTATAHDATELFVLGRDRYLGLLAKYPDSLADQMQDLSVQVGRLMRRLSELAAGSVQTRLAFLFFTLHQKFGVNNDGAIDIHLPLSRQEIADMVGTTLETTIRTLSRFQKQNILCSTPKGFTILDPQCLRTIAETNCHCVHNPCENQEAAQVRASAFK
jgi:CRP-like cAMP-binding protein